MYNNRNNCPSYNIINKNKNLNRENNLNDINNLKNNKFDRNTNLQLH